MIKPVGNSQYLLNGRSIIETIEHHEIRKRTIGDLKKGIEMLVLLASLFFYKEKLIYSNCTNPFEQFAIAWNTSETFQWNGFLRFDQNNRDHFLHLNWKCVPVECPNWIIDLNKFMRNPFTQLTRDQRDRRWPDNLNEWNGH